MSQACVETFTEDDLTANAAGKSSVVLVCEHASHHIPVALMGLGLTHKDRKSHAAWDPGALGVAQKMSQNLDAPLVAARVSRLVYDCNRPPTAHDAMPARSEVVEVPGNANLSQAERDSRIDGYYRPFRSALQAVIQRTKHPILITVHSFTPVYHGKTRSVEIGVLHDSDTRLADILLQTAGAHTRANVQRNEPYGPEHGVTHTLLEHAIDAGHLNVMLEVRNDLIATAEQQEDMADMITRWVVDAFGQMNAAGYVQWRG